MKQKIYAVVGSQVNYDGTYTIPEGIKIIGKFAFYNNEKLKTIIISKDVERIDENAFYCCRNLSSIVFESGSNLTSIGGNAFAFSNLRTVNLPQRVKYIGYRAFDKCENLLTATIPEGAEVGENAFCEKVKITKI